MSATPRPWQVSGFGIYNTVPIPGQGYVDYYVPIAVMVQTGTNVPDPSIQHDNAVLIVRAVNLLDVMKEAQAALTLSLDTMRGMTDYFEDGLEKAMLDRTVKECKAVLARMSG